MLFCSVLTLASSKLFKKIISHFRGIFGEKKNVLESWIAELLKGIILVFYLITKGSIGLSNFLVPWPYLVLYPKVTYSISFSQFRSFVLPYKKIVDLLVIFRQNSIAFFSFTTLIKQNINLTEQGTNFKLIFDFERIFAYKNCIFFWNKG